MDKEIHPDLVMEKAGFESKSRPIFLEFFHTTACNLKILQSGTIFSLPSAFKTCTQTLHNINIVAY